MKEYAATVSIRATPEAIWAILTDGPGYASWNPEIVRVDGPIESGGLRSTCLFLGFP